MLDAVRSRGPALLGPWRRRRVTRMVARGRHTLSRRRRHRAPLSAIHSREPGDVPVESELEVQFRHLVAMELAANVEKN